MSQIQTTQKKRLLAATIFTFVFMVGFAVSASMLGTLLPGIINWYGISRTSAASISTFYEAGGIGAMVLTLTVVDRMDKGRLLPLSAVLFGVVLLVHGFAPPFALLLLMRVVLGLVGVLLDNLCAAYISDLYGEHRAKYVSILHTLYAMGSLVAPKFAAFLYEAGGWGLSYKVLGAVFAVAGGLAILIFKVMGYPQTAVAAPGAGEKRGIPYREMLRDRNLLSLCAVSFLMAGQVYVSIWLSAYLDWVDSGIYTVELCSTIMTVYAVGMILSRMLLAAISEKLGAWFYLKWSTLLSPLVLVALILLHNPTAWLIGAFLYGLCCGGAYTAKVVLSCQEFPEYSATASAITGAFGTLGNIVLNQVAGAAADAGYYTQALLVSMALVFSCSLILRFIYKPREP